MTYTPREMMTIVAAREIQNRDIVFCGTGISMLAAMAAKHINAPEAVIFFETGAIGGELAHIPLAVGDSRVMYRAHQNGSLADAFGVMQNPRLSGRIIGILGAAQIDPFGNLNSTVIGDYHEPRVRFSGSGGALDVATFVGRTICFMQHDKRKFVNKLDYCTSPGWVEGNDSRAASGINRGGPALVITDKAVMRFGKKDKRMVLDRFYPGETPESVSAHMSFSVDTSSALEALPPTDKELEVLRNRCDPDRFIL